jgi:hypothetical protein
MKCLLELDDLYNRQQKSVLNKDHPALEVGFGQAPAGLEGKK